MNAEVISVPQRLNYTNLNARYCEMLDLLGITEDEAAAMNPHEFSEAVQAKARDLAQQHEQTALDEMLNEPIQVQLRDRNYDVRALTIREDRAWRRRCGDAMGRIMQGIATEDRTELLAAVAALGSDEVIELMYLYVPAMANDRDWIETTCTSAELISVAAEVFSFAHPTVVAIMRTMGLLLKQ